VLQRCPGLELRELNIVFLRLGNAHELDNVAVLQRFVVVWYPGAVVPRKNAFGVMVGGEDFGGAFGC